MSGQAQFTPPTNVYFGRARPERIAIGQAFVDRCSFEDAVTDITSHALARRSPAFVVTPNAQHVVLLEREPRLREVYREADLVVPDGYSLLLGARVLGRKFPERVAGVDLFQALCGSAAGSGLRVFLLGGLPGSADLAASAMRKRFPGLQVATCCPPFGFENSETELARVEAAITGFKPGLIFVALGAPKQEYWMYDHGRRLGASVCVGIGGSLEMVSGKVPRAPRWIREIGCEWLYRLCREPRRMWRRYLFGNLQFARILMQQVLARGVVRTIPENARATSAVDHFQ